MSDSALWFQGLRLKVACVLLDYVKGATFLFESNSKLSTGLCRKSSEPCYDQRCSISELPLINQRQLYLKLYTSKLKLIYIRNVARLTQHV